MTDKELELLKEKIISYVVDLYNNGDTDFEECWKSHTNLTHPVKVF